MSKALVHRYAEAAQDLLLKFLSGHWYPDDIKFSEQGLSRGGQALGHQVRTWAKFSLIVTSSSHTTHLDMLPQRRLVKSRAYKDARTCKQLCCKPAVNGFDARQSLSIFGYRKGDAVRDV